TRLGCASRNVSRLGVSGCRIWLSPSAAPPNIKCGLLNDRAFEGSRQFKRPGEGSVVIQPASKPGALEGTDRVIDIVGIGPFRHCDRGGPEHVKVWIKRVPS